MSGPEVSEKSPKRQATLDGRIDGSGGGQWPPGWLADIDRCKYTGLLGLVSSCSTGWLALEGPTGDRNHGFACWPKAHGMMGE